MKLLALESSGDYCSVALYLDGQLQEKLNEAEAQQHSRLLLPMQQSLLAEAGLGLGQLDLIACSTGPGSFTGVRIATALTQGLAFAADIPVLGVSTLACMAHAAAAQAQTQALVLLDARMSEVYWAHYQYQENGLQTLQAEALARPADLPALALDNCIGLGNGWQHYAQDLQSLSGQCRSIDAAARPTAGKVATLAAQQLSNKEVSPYAAAELQPLYIRNQVTTPAKSGSGLSPSP